MENEIWTYNFGKVLGPLEQVSAHGSMVRVRGFNQTWRVPEKKAFKKRKDAIAALIDEIEDKVGELRDEIEGYEMMLAILMEEHDEEG